MSTISGLELFRSQFYPLIEYRIIHFRGLEGKIYFSLGDFILTNTTSKVYRCFSIISKAKVQMWHLLSPTFEHCCQDRYCYSTESNHPNFPRIPLLRRKFYSASSQELSAEWVLNTAIWTSSSQGSRVNYLHGTLWCKG